MGIDFYYMGSSIPCRSVLMLAKAIEVPLNLIQTNIMTGENKTEEFLALNPTHTIPVIKDGDFVLWESRAILIYLAERYGESVLYPVDAEKKAEVNKLLFFDMGTLFKSWQNYYIPQFFLKEDPNEELAQKCEEALAWLDSFLDGKEWAAGDEMSVADFSLVATVSTFECLGFDLSAFASLSKWFEKCKNELPGYDLNVEGLEELKASMNQ